MTQETDKIRLIGKKKKEKEDIWDVELENCLHKEKYIMIQSSRHVLRPARREIPCNIGI